MKINILDSLSFPISTTSQREYTPEGFLKVPGRVARAGVQQYLASELGLTDRPAAAIVNVYRPPDEVFSQDSLESYDNADVTIDHPRDLVTADTFKLVTVGHAISAGRQDPEDSNFIIVDMLIKDKKAIADIDSGKAFLSAGYTADYKQVCGVDPLSGNSYEYIQTNVYINHIAICDGARAGYKARLFDSKVGVNPMVKVTLDSGVVVEVADDATKTLINKTLSDLRQQVKDAEEAKKEAEDEKEKAEGERDAKDEENKELKEQTSDAAIESRLVELVATRDAAKRVAGKDFTSDSLNPLTIKQEALSAAKIPCKKYGTWDKAPESYLSAFFDVEEERKQSEDEEKDKEKQKSEDSLQGFAKDMQGIKVKDANTAREKARQAFIDSRYGNSKEDKQ